jgi:hypothetical protein
MARAKPQPVRRRVRRSEEFALAPHQLIAVRDPCAPIRAVVATQAEGYAGRPYSLWRDDPELARALNERLGPHSD